jgi:hypothetical protein
MFCSKSGVGLGLCSSCWLLFRLLLCSSFLSLQSRSEVSITTLGGGPVAGLDNGDLEWARFTAPQGLATDGDDYLYICDPTHHLIRRVQFSAHRVTTFVPRANVILNPLDRPVAAMTKINGDLFVLNRGSGPNNGSLLKFDRFGNLWSTNAAGLQMPTAFTFGADGMIFVAETGGKIQTINPLTGAIALLFRFNNGPTLSGMIFLDDGHLAVTDATSHTVWKLDPVNAQVSILAGGNGAGFQDGAGIRAQFNGPAQMARAPNGSLLVADQFNHRVRIVGRDGFVRTLYGMDSGGWTADFPGWRDGEPAFAEGREPFGVAVNRVGRVFVGEIYYHVLRQIDGAELTVPGGLQTLPAPLIHPSWGYYPNSQLITISNAWSNGKFDPGTRLFYTTDGSEPNMSSAEAAVPDTGLAEIIWNESLRDLRSLRVRSYSGTNFSQVARGQPCPRNEIGLPADCFAGTGATAVIPLVANLTSNQVMRSVQFLIEVTPVADTPMPDPSVRLIVPSTNEFKSVVIPHNKALSTSDTITTKSNVSLPVVIVGTNTAFAITNYGVITNLILPVPPSAKEGDSYLIRVVHVSGTSDGFESELSLTALPPRTVRVRNIPYLIGDIAEARWYNAGEFGNGSLSNADVNRTFWASLGVQVPYVSSDAFDAMDAFPFDTSFSAGGDRAIRFLDWQVTLRRALGQEPTWSRSWSSSGIRIPISSPNSSGTSKARLAGLQPAQKHVWVRQALIGSAPVESAIPGQPVRMPVYLRVGKGFSVSGLAFRLSLEPIGASPAITEPMRFESLLRSSDERIERGDGPADLLCGWSLNSLAQPLQGATLLGYLHFQLPDSAKESDSYQLLFRHHDGAPDLQTQYDFESLPATVTVLAASATPFENISVEWKAAFFAGAHESFSRPESDPDGDRMSNLAEFFAGTDPWSEASKLEFLNPRVERNALSKSILLRWNSVPGRSYAIQASSSILDARWITLAEQMIGTGTIMEFPIAWPVESAFQCFRIVVEP